MKASRDFGPATRQTNRYAYSAYSVWRHCGRKLKYRSKEVAEEAISHAVARGEVDMAVYFCEMCGFYHMGHRRRRNGTIQQHSGLPDLRARR